MNTITSRLLAILFLALPVTGGAEPREIAASLTLDQAVTAALRDNAQLQAMRLKAEAMSDRPVQERTPPNPMLSYAGMDMTARGSWPNTNEKRVMLEQTFPWFGKLALKGKVAGKEAEAMQREYETMAREVVMMVKETYADLYGVQQARLFVRGEEAVLSNMLTTAESMYATGGRSQQDVLKAQTEVTMLRQKLLTYDEQEVTLQAKLNQLLSRPVNTATGLAVTPPADSDTGELNQLLALAAGSRAEIKKADADIQRSQYERDVMRKEYWPDYKLGLEYRNFRQGDDMVMFTVGVELPIWRSKYRAGEREAEKMIASTRAARTAAEQQTEFDVRDAHFKLQTARRTLELYRKELIPQAEMRFKASDADYRTGKGDFMDLLESERFLLDARVMAAMAEASVGMQLARLERAVGTDLENKK
jgi:outer membrane protein TolC